MTGDNRQRRFENFINHGIVVVGDNADLNSEENVFGLPGDTRDDRVKETRLRRALNKSFLVAQIPPGFLCILPILVPLALAQLRFPLFQDLPTVWKIALWIVGLAAPSIAISYVVLFLSHATEKRVFPRQSKSAFSYLLSHSNDRLATPIKERFREAFKRTFDEELPSYEQEQTNLELTLDEIGKNAVKVKSKTDESRYLRLLRLGYQLTRNSVGASKLGLVFATIAIVHGIVKADTFIILAEAILILFFAVLLLQRKKLLVRASENYTVQLISDFNHSNSC